MTPADLTRGDIVLWRGLSYKVTAVRSVRDTVHERLYFLSLEAEGRLVTVTCAERYQFG